jgi:glycosyltransferase involved in cell wall biosynthesis
MDTKMDTKVDTSNNNCTIGLCVYNNERGLPSVLSNIVAISQSNIFDKLTVVAFYDASADKSYSILESFKNQHSNSGSTSIETVIISNKAKEFRMSFGNASRVLDKSRTMRIAAARNEILNYMRFAHKRGQSQSENNKYFIMMDSNEYACVGQINLDTLRDALQRSDEWDSISFNREAGYYDYWALSFAPHIYSFYHVQNKDDALNKMVTEFATKLNASRNSREFIPVYSAFNGFAIYKASMFLNCSYSSFIHIHLFPKQLLPTKIVNYFKNDCEHRKFHLEAIKKNGARIMVSPLSIFYKIPVPNPSLRGPA